MKPTKILFSLMFLLGVAACSKPPVELTCSDSLKKLNLKSGDSINIKCPANCLSGSLWGSEVYTADSYLCVAAVHDGKISKEGGTATILVGDGKESFEASTKNGVASNSWGKYDTSFSIK